MRLRRTVRQNRAGPWHVSGGSDGHLGWRPLCKTPRSTAYSSLEFADSSEVEDLPSTACQRCLAVSPEFEALVDAAMGE